jgi:hypothetical protein
MEWIIKKLACKKLIIIIYPDRHICNYAINLFIYAYKLLFMAQTLFNMKLKEKSSNKVCKKKIKIFFFKDIQKQKQ